MNKTIDRLLEDLGVKAVKIYPSASLFKKEILEDNKKLSGIYMNK